LFHLKGRTQYTKKIGKTNCPDISRIELISAVFNSLSKFFNLVVVLNDWTVGLYAALAIQVSILLNF
jgi:hypothetical protein